jgi:hypothetical protein
MIVVSSLAVAMAQRSFSCQSNCNLKPMTSPFHTLPLLFSASGTYYVLILIIFIIQQEQQDIWPSTRSDFTVIASTIEMMREISGETKAPRG